jgi:hypothetical protein
LGKSNLRWEVVLKQRIVIKDQAKRLVYGEVYAPLQIDTDGEAMTEVEIEKMAHHFMMTRGNDAIDVQHSYTPSGCLIVESFIARKDDPDGFVDGSWVLGVKVVPDEIWNAVQKGELNGFSFAGNCNSVTVRARVNVTRKMIGETEKSEQGLLPPHDHPVDIEFDENGSVTKGISDFVMGHQHKIFKTTATERDMEHSHRLILIDN